jgi:hypothetical protein
MEESARCPICKRENLREAKHELRSTAKAIDPDRPQWTDTIEERRQRQFLEEYWRLKKGSEKKVLEMRERVRSIAKKLENIL